MNNLFLFYKKYLLDLPQYINLFIKLKSNGKEIFINRIAGCSDLYST